ncbi:hypothetical protein FNH22_01890 [Fulvivirga sp. M361]|uniref:hypothetical protein n=1 Tax=Fulvivirga sp. M361 TaxID=2594266 RepID=UPI00117A48E6|nr:hypothetical protein [Fulvivirga sp. M361]TRX62096.1 hypothetical protein FNH22_01890 [Fulvivirga sp. M361]
MKRNVLNTFLVVLALTFTACGDDDEAAPSHEVGKWDLKSYALINVPSEYASNEGLAIGLNQINLGITDYDLELNSNGSFDRSITFIGRLPQDDLGTWVLEDDELTLDSDESSDNEEFTVEKNQSDDLWLSVSSSISLRKDAINDTLTAAYFNSLTAQEQQALSDQVSLDLVFVFGRDE